MHIFSLLPLPELRDPVPVAAQQTSGDDFPILCVPKLADKPQNPIFDTASSHKVPKLHPRVLLADTSSQFLRSPSVEENQRNKYESLGVGHLDDLWLQAATCQPGPTMNTLSWDKLRPSFSSTTLSTPFLSESEPFVYASARHLVAARLKSPDTEVIHVTNERVLNALKMTVSGTSSVLHVWNQDTERFVQKDTAPGRVGHIMIEGQDETSSHSILDRFLRIGTLMRRLEVLVGSLRSRSVQEGPTIYAFAHTLSNILAYLRNEMSHLHPIRDHDLLPSCNWMAIWLGYEIYEVTLIAISSLYDRSENLLPEQYVPVNSSPGSLLSRIYQHLQEHIERQSPRMVIAMLAYILTNASRHYLAQISHSVAYGGDTVRRVVHVVGEKNDQYVINDAEDEGKDSGDIESLADPDTYPSFFPPELVAILPGAQRSLSLLRAAQPGHPLLKLTFQQPAIAWFWTIHEIATAWDEQHLDRPPSTAAPRRTRPPTDAHKPEMVDFRLYDMEPGSQLGETTAHSSVASSLEAFITNFPDALPPATPTPPHLASLVFAPLFNHASSLSNALLSLLLYSQGKLNIQAHLRLLRSYLLLTSPSFKSRLSLALFSDTPDHTEDPDGGAAQVGIGIAPVLLAKETWPPVGSDLSFTLRTVIVDSFEYEIGPRGSGVTNQILEEAEYRLGFAIRNLSTGPGRNKWMDPASIEALDFLYMDYKPPSPLEIIIRHDILSKYQRVFAFLLRLLRVENAMRIVYRSMRDIHRPLFPTLVPARKRLYHFRFVAQEFLFCISSYIFDAAIAGNFDPFLRRLGPHSDQERHSRPLGGFSDVFDLAECHSTLLNDILSACLLRSSQKGMGELLRGALEDVLEFAVLVGDLYGGRREEYVVDGLLDDLYTLFYEKVSTLCKLLKNEVDKTMSAALRDGIILPNAGDRPPVGGVDVLYHLLIRLDMGDWWVSHASTA